MRCTILGCGSSNGVPEIACHCCVCKSPDPKNKRLRASIYIESQNASVLVDTSPDLRQQALKHNIKNVDAVLYTHDHSDHIMGIDDIKYLNRKDELILAYMDAKMAEQMPIRFTHIFKQMAKWYPARMEIKVIEGPFAVHDIQIQPFIQQHGKINSTGFRFGELAYSTDLNELSDQSIKLLQGVKYWIVDCLRYNWAPTHAHIDKTLAWIERVKPEVAILTHMAHAIDYYEIQKMLPRYVIPAFDGMVIDFN